MAAATIGVLALQGAFVEHIDALESVRCPSGTVRAIQVRTPEELAQCDGIVIPGGESTTMSLLASKAGLIEPLRSWVSEDKPVFGTCAGLILLANEATSQKKGGQELIRGLDVTVDRNHYGRQNESFESTIATSVGAATDSKDASPFRAVFIRAPAIMRVGSGVEILATCSHNANTSTVVGPASSSAPAADGDHKQQQHQHSLAVAVRQDRILGLCFHPELTTDTRWHELFVKMVIDSKSKDSASSS